MKPRSAQSLFRDLATARKNKDPRALSTAQNAIGELTKDADELQPKGQVKSVHKSYAPR